jgi:fructosamine-3-kinase
VTLAQRVAAAVGSEVVTCRAVLGGDLNDAYRLELADGRTLFAKTRAGTPPGTYAAEAAALRWLAEPKALPLPEPVAHDDTFLALRWIDAGGRPDDEQLGRGLAILHTAGASSFGEMAPGTPGDGRPPLRLGPLVLPNDEVADWPTFYAESRLMPLVDRAGVDASLIERVCNRINDLAGPSEPPARLHGDLWTGNVMADTSGRPVLIDPAAYGGHREIDLAMLQLFGSPSARFYAAYEEVAPLAPGAGDRVALYQLFPLLVHAVLFGGGYAASVERAAGRYA